jgi:hypothetical protein
MKYGLISIEQQQKDLRRLEAEVLQAEIELGIKKLALLKSKLILIESEIEAENEVTV